jgi:hypothetical protein
LDASRRRAKVHIRRNYRDGQSAFTGMRKLLFVGAFLVALAAGALPAWANITGPASAHVLPGTAVSINMQTDGTNLTISGNPPIVVQRLGSAPTFRFTFKVPEGVEPDSYVFIFNDGVDTFFFSLIVVSPPAPPTTAPP